MEGGELFDKDKLIEWMREIKRLKSEGSSLDYKLDMDASSASTVAANYRTGKYKMDNILAAISTYEYFEGENEQVKISEPARIASENYLMNAYANWKKGDRERHSFLVSIAPIVSSNNSTLESHLGVFNARREEYIEKKDLIIKFQQEILAMKEELKEKERQFIKGAETLASERQQFKDMENKLQTELKQLTFTTSEKISNEAAKFNVDKQNLQHNIGTLNSEKEKLERELSELKAEIQKYLSENKSIKSSFLNLQSEAAAFKTDLNKCKAKEEGDSIRITHLESEVRAKDELIAKEKKIFEDQKESDFEKITFSTKRIMSLEAESKSLHIRLSTLKDNYDEALLRHKVELEKKTNELSKNSEQCEEKIKANTQSFLMLEKRMNEKTQEYDELTRKFKGAEDSINQLKIDVGSKSKENIALQAANSDYVRMDAAQKASIEHLQHEIAKSAQNIRSLGDTIALKDNNLREVADNAIRVQNEYSKQDEKNLLKIRQLIEKTEELTVLFNGAKESIASKEGLIERLESNLSLIKDEISVAKARFAVAEKALVQSLSRTNEPTLGNWGDWVTQVSKEVRDIIVPALQELKIQVDNAENKAQLTCVGALCSSRASRAKENKEA